MLSFYTAYHFKVILSYWPDDTLIWDTLCSLAYSVLTPELLIIHYINIYWLYIDYIDYNHCVISDCDVGVVLYVQ